MAGFNRKIKRQKSEFSFSKKQVPKKTKLDIFKENFSFRWIKLNFKAMICLLISFIFISIACIPLLVQFIDPQIAFVLGHGFLTSLLIVLTFVLIQKEKPTFMELLIRYAFMAMLLLITSLIAVLLV